jgi:acetolactate synthase I/II/III large subunit
MFSEESKILEVKTSAAERAGITNVSKITPQPLKASDLFVKALESEGVEYVFGIPGEENLDLLESLRNSSIKVVLTRHEQAAGFMAATYGRLTGRVGVCLTTLGPGATNLVTAAAYAKLGGMPMLMVTGQKPIKTSKQGLFQIVDVVEMMRPLTKHTGQIVSAARIPAQVREAIRLAEEERPGVVHLEFPEDIAREETSAPIHKRSQVGKSVADEISIERAVELIERSTHPLLLIGSGANRDAAIAAVLRQFVEKTGIPFIDTQLGKGVIDEYHPLFIGNAALSANDFVHRAVERADLILCVGHDVIEKPPFIMGQDGAMVIHVNFTSAIVDPIYFPQVEVVGDIAESIWCIKQCIAVQGHWDFSYFLRVKACADTHAQHSSGDSHFPVRPQRVVADVRTAMPHDGIVALDNGMYKIWFARNYRAHLPKTLLLDNALATMGAGLPSAIAASLMHPDRKVVAVCGDGGFMMNSQELETAVRLKLNLVVLILRDDGLGMIKWKQENMGFQSFGLDYSNPDFVQYARSYGAQGYRVEAAEELLPILDRCLNMPGVHVVDLPVDYSENTRILSCEISELSRSIQ